MAQTNPGNRILLIISGIGVAVCAAILAQIAPFQSIPPTHVRTPRAAHDRPSQRDRVNAHARSEPTGRGQGTATISAIKADSAALHQSWTAPGADADAIYEAARESREAFKYLHEDFAAYEAFDMWIETLAAPDSEFGQNIAACIVQYERTAGRDCVWQHEVVVARDPGDPEVSHVVHLDQQFDFPEARVRENCLAYADCIASVWRHRSGPPIPSRNGQYLALRSLGSPITIGAAHEDPEQYLATYRRVREGAANDLADDEARLGTNSLPNTIHNARLSRSILTHLDTVMEQLDG